jgi:glycosyltransferase involved in cell wall biosynthesis
MHFGRPVIAFDCAFNRFTTDNKAIFFQSSEDLASLLEEISPEKACEVGDSMRKIAGARYRWDVVAAQYFQLL